MKSFPGFSLLTLLILIFWSCSSDKDNNISYLSDENKNVMNIIDSIRFESGNWDVPSYEKAGSYLGNHRAVIEVPSEEELVRLYLPWRRKDISPEKKQVIIVNTSGRDTVKNVSIREINREYLDLVFKPQPKIDVYHVYYFPYQTTGGYYPTVTYPEPSVETNEWSKKIRNLSKKELESLPQAKVVAIQSINDFHSFFPMEIPATQLEVERFLTRNPQTYYLFPEFRNNPVRMSKYLPYHWANSGIKNGISDEAKKGEFYTFQVAVYSPSNDLVNINLLYTELKSRGKNKISKEAFECINIDGVDLNGKEFKKKVDVPKGKIQPFWVGIDIPEDIASDIFRGMIIIQPEDMNPDTIHLELKVSDEVIIDHGDNEPENMTRLRWLNSTLGSEDDFIISPFNGVEHNNTTLKILGREIEIGEFGFPAQIRSYFKEEMTGIKDTPEDILSSPVNLEVSIIGKRIEWKQTPVIIRQSSDSKAEWLTNSSSDDIDLTVNGLLEYDGMLNYEIQLVVKNDAEIDDISLGIPFNSDAAKYILGLGYKGTTRPKSISWKWDVTNHQEGIWLGNVNKGLQYVLRDKNYQRPLNTNFYQSKPLNLPHSWYNDGKGGIKISTSNETVLCQNYSGSRSVSKGDTLNFHIRFLITPFKPIDTKTHFQTRFVHKYIPVDSVLSYGGTVVNVHHANEINPYINYPFFNLDLQSRYIKEAHEKGVKVKLYNTIRELTYKAYELFPMRSLGFEIYNDGEGGGHPWLQEHLEADYHKAWHAWRVNDAAILNKGTSRWTNYYIEGLNWLAKNQEIDGLYLDDIAFSRETVKRMVSVLNRHRDNVIIDLHSANQFNERDGFINSAFLYMEHFPYISRLWFGEYFEYDLDPDYWLTEVSGIPFGLTGEMLQDGGHPYRGMVYGMTTRVYGDKNPQAIWQLFDEFGIDESEMIGYWVSNVPVKSNNPKVLVTVYKKNKEVLLALGSWSGKDELINLDIDWERLGISSSIDTKWFVPGVNGLQEERILEANKPFTIDKEKGLFLILKE